MGGRDKKKRGSGTGDIISQGISRRDFIKKGIIGIAGIGFGAYCIKYLNNLPGGLTYKTFKNSAPDKLWKWSREAYYYRPFGGKARCMLCPFECILDRDERGICRTRVNKDNRIYSLTYGNPCTYNTDPIEKKPLYHFLPGSLAFTLATAGCNLRCKFCQNWEISQSMPEDLKSYDMLPEKTVETALNQKNIFPNLKTIAYSYSEPVAFYDYMIDTAGIGRERGFKNAVITAGYINREPLKELAGKVDAIKIDLKGFNEKFYREVTEVELDGVLEAIKVAHSQDVLLEIVNLVVPTLNDNMEELRQMSEWIRENAGRDVPLHFSRFHPNYKLRNLPPTPMDTLLNARETALDAGLNYVYIGNVPHGDYENTYCPKCRELVIERTGYLIKQNNIREGKCSACGREIAGVWV